jgi:hypothetical protein
MSFEWHAYKVFKNGKRAKAPLHNFIYNGNLQEATDYFQLVEVENLTEKFGKKIKNFDFKILNSEDSAIDETETPEEIYTKSKNRVLAKLIREKQINTKRKITGGLIYCKQTSWKWQWAALESATNNYIDGLSEQFDSYEGAKSWMNDKIKTL